MASYFPMIKNSAQRIVFPILDADGDPVTGAASDTPDSEYSLDGASFSDCSDEIHEIATNSGIYYLDLLAAETNGGVVALQIKTATAGTKTTVLVFYTSAQSLDTVDGVVDGIQTDLSNATDGLGALKTLLDTISGYTDKIDDAINGLTAIKAEVEGIGGVAMRGTDNGALEATLTTMKHKVAGAFDRETDSLEALRDRGDAAWVTGGGGAGDATEAKQDILIKILTNKWEVTGNQFIIYDDDGVTPLYTYNLTQDGSATEYNPDLRTPV